MNLIAKIMSIVSIIVALTACESYSAPNPQDCYTQIERVQTIDREKIVPTTYCLDKRGIPEMLSRSGYIDPHQEAQLRKMRE